MIAPLRASQGPLTGTTVQDELPFSSTGVPSKKVLDSPPGKAHNYRMTSLATTPQISFLTALLGKIVALDAKFANAAALVLEVAPTETTVVVSDRITRAQATLARLQASAPAPVVAAAAPVAATVPDGSYALDGADGALRFYDVETPAKGKWAGFTFLSVAASDERYPIKGSERTRILAEIAVDPLAAATRYGLHFSVCACCHRQLTDETSRAIGLGPICARRF